MDQNIEPAPFFPNLIKQRIQLSRDRDVEFAGDRRLELLGQRFDPAPRLPVQPGNGQIRADRAKRLGAAIGN